MYSEHSYPFVSKNLLLHAWYGSSEIKWKYVSSYFTLRDIAESGSYEYHPYKLLELIKAINNYDTLSNIRDSCTLALLDSNYRNEEDDFYLTPYQRNILNNYRLRT